MVSSGLGLALTPIPLIAAAFVLYAMPERWGRLARPVALAGAGVAYALLIIDAAVVAGGGRVQVTLGQLGGTGLALRGDPTAVVIALAAATATVLMLLDRSRRRREATALLMCLAGSVTAAFAADAVTLFAGLEGANLGGLLLLAPPRGRAGRGVIAAAAVEHLGALGLLSAAVQLQTEQGTSAFALLPTGAVTAAVAWPWAAAAVARLLSPVVVPIRGARAGSAAWAAVATIPCGAALVLRLRAAVGDAAFPTSVLVLLEVVGALAAVAGAAVAVRNWRSPTVAGRGLCIVAAAPVLALTGVGGSAAATAVAAGVCALELAVACSAAWERGSAGWSRWLAPAALLAAGGLPTGFGATAVALELGTVATLGRVGMALLTALLLAMVVAAASAAAMAWSVFRAARPGAPRPALGIVAVLLSAVAAILPGGAASTVVSVLAGGGVSRPASAAAVLGPGGGWAGGYLLVALAVLAIGAWAARVLIRPPAERVLPTGPPAPSPAGPLPLRSWRSLHGPVGLVLAAAGAVDAWLQVQPQLPLVVGGAVLALLLVH
ncbi:MAG: hypothetical protein JOZ46_03780 [Candidatus Dormibacteraeota bacterium]|nr:hypothetical protein [Candidatus Dormibacteraeota bacterium]MBV9524922.1 hypothetical protein [Candidatus Dormibacteraeota bacterium]